ncbi:cytochrome P450 3A24-like [Mercenaria mercenaria]|uniref:cytochrome P450 3A24-like n=1 Tax=Mercenaria mercenaria TaxID=6596 RepID=UPI00234E673F|nr:cytochrome P450 3A24-like [Mercenaria mercenaria]
MLLLGLLEVPTWLVFILFLVLVYYLYTARKHSLFRRYGIPAIQPSPFIGGFPYLAKRGIMGSEYDATMKYGKVVGFFIGNMPTIFLTEPDLIRELYVKQFNNHPNRSKAAHITKFWQQTILQTTDYNNWRFLRSTLTPAFTSGKLRKMDKIVGECVDRTINQLKAKVTKSENVTDMIPVFQGITLDVICQSAMGVKLDTESEANNELRKQISNLLNFSLEKNPYLLILFFIPDMKKVMELFDIDFNDSKAVAYIKKCVDAIVKERKEDKNSEDIQDLLQLMINTNMEDKALNEKSQTEKVLGETHGEDDDMKHAKLEKPHRGMTDDEIAANAIMFLFAGYDTTSTAMIFTSYFLATQPECQEKIVQEIANNIGNSEPEYDNIQSLTYLDMFISESMRLYPPVTRINRNNDFDCKVGEYTFPGGISITTPVFTLHRLPEFWPEPEKFDPERFSAENKSKILPYTYLPFGAGPRNCVGMRFANMELKMTMVKLLQNFRIKPSPGLQIPPKLEKHVFCRPVGGMRLILEKRK